jgi:hypothetical protein
MRGPYEEINRLGFADHEFVAVGVYRSVQIFKRRPKPGQRPGLDLLYLPQLTGVPRLVIGGLNVAKQSDDSLSLTIQVGGKTIGTAKLDDKDKVWEIETAKGDDWVIYRQHLTDGIKDLMQHLGLEEPDFN